MFKKKKEEPVVEIEEDEEELDEEDESEEDDDDKTAPVEVKSCWSVQDIATETQQVIFNSKTKKVLTTNQALAEILNRLE